MKFSRIFTTLSFSGGKLKADQLFLFRNSSQSGKQVQLGELGEISKIVPETYNGVGSMHKYWGKKPYNVVAALIQKYTNEADVVLDPFCGSGVAVYQAVANRRKAVGVDINPIAIFLTKQSVTACSANEIEAAALSIVEKLAPLALDLYGYECECGATAEMQAGVRLREGDKLVRLKLKCLSCGTVERPVTEADSSKTQSYDAQEIKDWYPSIDLIHNSRINVKPGTKVSDLFTRRNLLLCARLWAEIQRVKVDSVRDALTVAFTANLPNASKLTPIIKQRGPMNAGAWMTGFYVAEEYLEQNVLVYFMNRVRKVCKAKDESAQELPRTVRTGNIFQQDADAMIVEGTSESLDSVPDGTIDFVFTDPPYGDAIPYLEQSIFWNAWLSNSQGPLEQEIIISDSKARSKNLDDYLCRISKSFSEISRVMKRDAKLAITFHSMSGDLWHGFLSSILSSGLELVELSPLYQKTSTPRQLNRKDSIKCDMLMIFKKSSKRTFKSLSLEECNSIANATLKELIESELEISTDQIISHCLPRLIAAGCPDKAFDLIAYAGSQLKYHLGKWYPIEDHSK